MVNATNGPHAQRLLEDLLGHPALERPALRRILEAKILALEVLAEFG